MKLLLAQPAIPRFRWELEVLLFNIRKFTDIEVVLLFSEKDFTVPSWFRDQPGCSVFVYTDRREDTGYIPSIRPYLLWQYLAEDSSREQETYFYVDSDIIFREWIDFATLGLNEQTVVGSHCGSYIDYDYIAQCTRGDEIAVKMAEICGITVEQMKGVPGIGAHLLLTNPTAAFWERAYYDSNTIYRYLGPLDSNVQKWTAEMWAQLWGWVREGKTLIAADVLKFCFPTDKIEEWDKVNILHNAGVTVDKSHELFFKGQYVDYPPFGKDLSFVRQDMASYRYVQAIQNTVNS